MLRLNAGGMPALFQHSRVIDDPGLDGLSLAQGTNDVLSGLAPDVAIAPWAFPDEVKKAIVEPTRFPRLRAGTCRDRLDALAIAIRENAESVGGKGFLLLDTRQVSTD